MAHGFGTVSVCHCVYMHMHMHMYMYMYMYMSYMTYITTRSIHDPQAVKNLKSPKMSYPLVN